MNYPTHLPSMEAGDFSSEESSLENMVPDYSHISNSTLAINDVQEIIKSTLIRDNQVKAETDVILLNYQVVS